MRTGLADSTRPAAATPERYAFCTPSSIRDALSPTAAANPSPHAARLIVPSHAHC